MNPIRSAALAAALCCAAPFATAGGHYVPGVEGIQAASVPPAGVYYLGYLVDYDIGSLRDADGDAIDIPGVKEKGSVRALANRFVWITPQKFLGADYGVEAIVPILRKDLDFTPTGSETGLGDVYVGPLVLGWHGAQWDAVAAAGVWLDNASSSTPEKPGNGYKSTMLTFGGTVYASEARATSASALFRFERNGSDDAGNRPGNQLTLEWGVGTPVGPVQLGVVGYDQWQTTTDEGAATNDKYQRHAVGAEVVYPMPQIGLFLKAAAYHEYSAEGRDAGLGAQARGNLLRLTVVKAF